MSLSASEQAMGQQLLRNEERQRHASTVFKLQELDRRVAAKDPELGVSNLWGIHTQFVEEHPDFPVAVVERPVAREDDEGNRKIRGSALEAIFTTDSPPILTVQISTAIGLYTRLVDGVTSFRTQEIRELFDQKDMVFTWKNALEHVFLHELGHAHKISEILSENGGDPSEYIKQTGFEHYAFEATKDAIDMGDVSVTEEMGRSKEEALALIYAELEYEKAADEFATEALARFYGLHTTLDTKGASL